jgi:peptidoglycan/xylan/chitin deacetylase (PgdA/CDA1 family)
VTLTLHPAAAERVLFGAWRPLVGPFDPPIARVSGPADELAEVSEGLPAGAALPEAVAVRLRRRGEVTFGEPEPVDLVAWSERRGRHSVQLVRADPSLLSELQLGAYHHPVALGRALRQALRRLPRLPARGRALRAVADAAFWRGVRAEATNEEWERFTRGYAVLLYHRVAGELKPGQEQLDLAPERFAAQMRMLRRLGFHPLTLEQAIAFHDGAPLPRRAVLVTADDAYADATAALTGHADRHPVMFVPTGAVGGAAHWTDGEPVSGWDELRALRAAGGELGAHSRTHPDLTTLDGAALEEEVGGARRELAQAVPGAPAALAYPHGRHDERVRAKAAEHAALAFTSVPGRNGAGTDRWCLRRVGVHAYDTLPVVAWKALTGEPVPGPWERRSIRRWFRTGARAGAARRPAGPPPPPPASGA